MPRLPRSLYFLMLCPVLAAAQSPGSDWLLDNTKFKAVVEKDAAARHIVLTNGLVRRTFFAGPNLATVGYDNLSTGDAMIRAIRPEAAITINGKAMDVGGLTGQVNHAYFTMEQVAEMKADPAAMRLVGTATGTPVAEFAWKQVRHHAPGAQWPPKGVSLRFDFEPGIAASGPVPGKVLWEDDFTKLDPAWKITRSNAAERVLFVNEGKPGEIYAPMNLHCFGDRPVPAGAVSFEAVIDGGTDLATSWGPGLGLVFGDGSVVKANLRPGDRGEHGHFELRDRGGEKLASVKEFAAADKGISNEEAYRLRATLSGDTIIWDAASLKQPDAWKPLFTSGRPAGPVKFVRVGKMDRNGGASDSPEKDENFGRSKIRAVTVRGEPDPESPAAKIPAAYRVSVHYEMYDGIPVLVKWLTVTNLGKDTLTVDRVTTEILAMPEHDNKSQGRGTTPLTEPQQILFSTDYAFGGVFDRDQTNEHVVHFRVDKKFTSQVNYSMTTPCLLEVSPDRGPAQDVAPGQTFKTFRTYEVAVDGDRERRGLTYRRSMRVIAPWTTENPLMMHVRSSDPAVVKAAIDQCAEVGFEMVILSFGSGFNAENDAPDYLAKWKGVADYAKSKGIEIGCYSLYASRSVGGGNDIVAPKDQPITFGSCPAITSAWGQSYLKKLKNLFPATGFSLFEHDGPYPGDVDTTARPPLQKGVEDSQWVHWKIWSDFYRELRAQGVYINAPDYYFLNGSNKTGMGYKEVNWSLPRAQQLIHTRQNIFDGTWEKTPSMGWMFVPLTEYHGGGAAATIEPLDQHIDHYEGMLMGNLMFGVQACYRGTRLYDTPRVRDMLVKNITWYKRNRAILEGDLIHLRRATGRTLDGMLHVNPGSATPAMLCVFNPTGSELVETWDVPLYYSGLAGTVTATDAAGKASTVTTDRLSSIKQQLRVPAGGFTWISYSRGK